MCFVTKPLIVSVYEGLGAGCLKDAFLQSDCCSAVGYFVLTLIYIYV